MNNIILNFQSSYSGGGLKRLVEFSSYFNDKGGAVFVVHPLSQKHLKSFSNNKYIIEKPSNIRRVVNRPAFASNEYVIKKIWDVEYAYGVPICNAIQAKKKILHISNVLPFVLSRYGYGVSEWLKFKLIFFHIIRSFPNCTHVSSESMYSLSLIRKWHKCLELYSQNGSDDEINLRNYDFRENKKNAVILGTHLHKNLTASLCVFDKLLKENSGLKLYVVGAEVNIPNSLKARADVIILGVQDRQEIVNLLLNSYYYISTTQIENSFNAASEGIYLAEESYISKIAPHLELLEGIEFEEVSIEGCDIPLLKVVRNKLRFENLKTWKQVADSLFFNS